MLISTKTANTWLQQYMGDAIREYGQEFTTNFLDQFINIWLQY